MANILIPIIDGNTYSEHDYPASKKTHIEISCDKNNLTGMAYVWVRAVAREELDNGYIFSRGGPMGEGWDSIITLEPMRRRNEKKLEALLRGQVLNDKSQTWEAIRKMCKEKNLQCNYE